MSARTATHKSGINPAAHLTGKVKHHIHIGRLCLFIQIAETGPRFCSLFYGRVVQILNGFK